MPSLQDAINAAGGPLALLRSGSGGFPHPIKSEFTNWRDDQESWRTTAALMDLSHHMSDLTVQGPDAYRLLADLGANSFKGFGPMKAKQFVTVSYDGYVIGDCILFCLAENLVRLVGRPPALNWVQYHAETSSSAARRWKCWRASRTGRRDRVHDPGHDSVRAVGVRDRVQDRQQRDRHRLAEVQHLGGPGEDGA